MAALIRQANSRYELANKPNEEKRKTYGGREERENNNNNNKTLSEKKEEAGNFSKQRDKGWIHS